jgi:GNAT superfamily N-acetyltransferase
MLREEREGRGLLPYPRHTQQTPAEVAGYLARQLENPRWVGVVAETREGISGWATGEIYRRPVGSPRWVGCCDLLYVVPEARGDVVAPRLIRLLLDESERRMPGCVYECTYMPGSRGEHLWRRLGFRPYLVTAAFVTEAGAPRQDDLLGKHADESRGGYARLVGEEAC